MSACRTWPAVLALLLSAIVSHAADDQTKRGDTKAQPAEQLFAKIKSLTGQWVATSGEHKGQTLLDVRVIAGGTSIVERYHPGTAQEMITVYHLDDGKVMLKHYCMLGNQPEYQATWNQKDSTITYEFAGATGLESKDEAHMHEGRTRLIDENTMESNWVMFVDGKPADEHSFRMTRKKPE